MCIVFFFLSKLVYSASFLVISNVSFFCISRTFDASNFPSGINNVSVCPSVCSSVYRFIAVNCMFNLLKLHDEEPLVNEGLYPELLILWHKSNIRINEVFIYKFHVYHFIKHEGVFFYPSLPLVGRQLMIRKCLNNTFLIIVGTVFVSHFTASHPLHQKMI